jgi:hypothetical protein
MNSTPPAYVLDHVGLAVTDLVASRDEQALAFVAVTVTCMPTEKDRAVAPATVP